MSDDNTTAVILKFALLLVVLIFFVAFCASNDGMQDEQAARRTLQASGFTAVEMTGWKPFTCGKGDTTSTGFKATNPAGQRVEGVVCCGLVMKACTVRF